MKKYLLPLLALSFSAIHCTKENEKIVVQEKVTQGSMILSGRGIPSAEKGQTGDYYLDLSSSELYGPKTKDGWGSSVLNLKGIKGDKGEKGDNGTNGQDGQPGRDGQNGGTPRIGDNGNWWVGNTDLGVKAQGNPGTNGQNGQPGRDGQPGQPGRDGQNGQPGRDGQNGETPRIGDNGNWWIGNEDTGKPARGAQGPQGNPGTNGQNGQPGRDGQNGADGSKILAGDGTPQASEGNIGDYFIDKVAKIFYGPKTASGWPTTGISLVPGNTIATADYQLSPDGKTLEKWLNPKTRFIDMNADPKLKEVTKIGNVAFDKQANNINYQLTTIIVGDKVTEIGNSAFRMCDRLKSVELPEGITRIENGTFEGCVRLQIIEIPESVTSIGDGAFSTCVKLSSVILPEHVNSLGNAAFGNCASLHSIIIRNKTPFAIANSVFQGTPIQNIYVFSEKVDDYKNAVAGPYKNKVKALDFPGDN